MPRTKEEQKSADEWHKDKCCTTKWMCGGIVMLVIGIIFLVTAQGLYNAFDLIEWGGAQYQQDCYIRAHSSECNTETCTDSNACSQNTYFVSPVDDNTCAVDECEKWENGCVAITFTTECAKQHEFSTGDRTICYSYQDDSSCNNAGRLDPDDKWAGQHTTWIVLLVFAIIFIIISIVFFVIGGIRCLCKKVDDDILGETNGTGCYWCMDYERCCYGESTGHATVINPQGRNLPVKDKKRRKKKSNDGNDGNAGGATRKKKKHHDDDDNDDYDEEQELR